MRKADFDYLEPSKRSCDNCEFNFGYVCAGYGRRTDNGEYTYGMSMDEVKKMFTHGCDDWGISLEAFIEVEEERERNLLKNKKYRK
ncbi:hypothetical protein SAMN05216349_1613 [Oribacterium sp. KHPX15]|uniref:hypothetical protein n=1 Tax=Oribacterium sp. KHPX15 TaxID=1855342 RepID=UPI00089838D4|nr:hypothetical protein [Oribacterium sp. KHPX15]SEA94129.1 hypothetical protein SAMN05216349_1613 [Oribacterium sp. KHPX15]